MPVAGSHKERIPRNGGVQPRSPPARHNQHNKHGSRTTKSNVGTLAAQESGLPPCVDVGNGGTEKPASVSADSNDFTSEQVDYLGSAPMDDPLCEAEMLQLMAEFNDTQPPKSGGNSTAILATLLVIPPIGGGVVRLMDKELRAEVASFPTPRIRLCARGQPASPDCACFAISFTQPQSSAADGSQAAATHQCHIFRCPTSVAAGRILLAFANAFRNVNASSSPNRSSCSPTTSALLPSSSAQHSLSASKAGEEFYEFEAFLEIKEREDPVKGHVICPMERNCFKLRRDLEKRVSMVLAQKSGPRPLRIVKCFGLLLAPGRYPRHQDMYLLHDMHHTQGGTENSNPFAHSSDAYEVDASWDPRTISLDVLNTETPKETRVFMTIAMDVALEGINEAIRFNVECKARIFQQFERFWNLPRKAVTEHYTLLISRMDDQVSSSSADGGATIDLSAPTPHDAHATINVFTAASQYKVVKFESAKERERSISAARDNICPSQMPTQLIHPAEEGESDSDEPLLSGSGEVSRVCPENTLAEWRALIERWREDPETRPPELNSLIHDGVPDVLRGEVWQLLARIHADEADLVQTYHILLEKECPSEQVISRDINRTFPAHEYFKESSGQGQEALYRISKAYSLYDEEVSYCQGLSFLAAALLLHMPEEKAFCVLIKVMFNYGLRDLFKLGFDTLHLRFHQLSRLMEDYEHELFLHFSSLGVETHMFASQWFLTLFTAKFPLQMVFFVVDLFLSEGVNTIFHISLALLQDSKKDLLQLDFEGSLKYFRVALPRRYRTESGAKELIHNAVKLKISHKRLSKYEKEYRMLKQRELESLDPLERAEREISHLKATIMRLERENDDLAHELVTSKIELRNKLDTTEDQLENSIVAVERRERDYSDLSEQFKVVRDEAEQLKGMLRRETAKLEDEAKRARGLSEQYKASCSTMEKTFQADREKFEERKKSIMALISGCERCSPAAAEWIADSPRTQRQASAAESDSHGEVAQLNGALSVTEGAGGVSVFQLVELMSRLEEQAGQVSQLELELAQTKLALVESQCRNQDLTHQLMTASMESQHGGNKWLKKTISSICDNVSNSINLKSVAPAPNTAHYTSRGHNRTLSNVSLEGE